MAEYGTLRVKTGLAEMLKGGVIMDVVDADQARIAESAGACAVMALERVPADIRRDGGVARMSDPQKIREIQEAVSIPVMAKCRIGHFAEAQILQELEVDYIDESEVLTPADLSHHVDKWAFTVPFVCGATNLGEALRRISEGAAMIRTKGEAGTGGVARMSDPQKIREIQEAVSIPVMAKCRIGHFAEAQILQELEVDYIDESEVLTPADLSHHVDKWAFTVPFVCGATNLGEALRRISEGAAMIRTKGEAGTGDIVNAVTHMRSVFGAIRELQALRDDELYSAAKEHRAPYELVRWVAENGRLPVVTFTAGGIATPADASLCMQLGADGVFVGSGIFKSGRDPLEDFDGWVEDVSRRARAIVEATTHFDDAKVLADVSAGLGQPMVGISASSLPEEERLEVRGW